MPIEIKNAFKLDGTDHEKILSPEKTMAVFKEKCAAAGLEILETTRRIDNNRLGIPVYFSICGHDAERLTRTRKQMGKGTTPALAEASAVMELAERFSLYSFMEEGSNFIYDTYANVKHEAIPFELIAKSVDDQAGAEELEALEAIFSRIQFKWAKAYNFTRNREMLIPLDWFFMINEFNGSSAGNGNEEAICQGACEIVERHVSALVDKNRPAPVFIDPESIANPSTKALVDKFNRAGVELYITDFSLDTGIPTIGILAFDPSTFPHTSEMVWTAGTATNPDKAMSRALTEVAQLAGDFNTASSYLASGLPKFKSLKEADYLIAPGKSGKARRVHLDQLPDISSTNIKEEIGAITRALEKNGQELITVQTTDPRLGIPAFYSMVPGTAFRERAANSSIAMFAARHIHENRPAEEAAAELAGMDRALPDRYCIKFYRGMCSLESGDAREALNFFETAMALDPADQDIPSICSYTGVCLKELGEYEIALSILEKGIVRDPDREDIHNLMGFCHFMLKQHKRSIDCFEKVLALNPASAIDHASIASNHRELGSTAEAIKYYEMALALDPELDFARKNLERLTNLN